MESPIINLQECSELIHYSKGWIYLQSSLGNIPKIKRGGKLLFNRQEILNWIAEGRIKTNEEKMRDMDESFVNDRKIIANTRL